jgi:Uma2 family endonuclease
MNLPAPKPATYADLEAVPEHLVAEIIYGTLFTHPRPVPKHATAQSALNAKLGNPFQFGAGGPGGWVFMTEPELHLGPHVVVPDIAGWRIERLPMMPETAWVETAPDWVCEILSPSTENIDRGKKLPIYGTYGVGHCWLVNPVTRFLEAYELREGKWLLVETFAEGAEVAAPPFAAAPFPLSALWPLRLQTPDKQIDP